MAKKSQLINVRVEGRTLWVGGAGYPLHNITSVAPYKYTYKPSKDHEMSGCGMVVAFIVAIVAAQVAIEHFKWFGKESVLVSSVVSFVLFIAMIGNVIARLASSRKRVLYLLEIGTAGRSQVALAVSDADQAHDLARLIMEAIGDPQATFNMIVENFHVGDVLTTHGNNSGISVGK